MRTPTNRNSSLQLKLVTITGADDDIAPEELMALSSQYPFVEWGVLLSKHSEGNARFPSRKWMDQLQGIQERQSGKMRLSGHICGRWVRDICDGEWTICDDLRSIAFMFNRWQLNFHAYLHKINWLMFVAGLHLAEKQIIFQLDDVNNELLGKAREDGVNAVPFFDRSGGAGVLPKDWPKIPDQVPLCGYAGGLSPENVVDQLNNIEIILDGSQIPIWIDMESGVRTDNKFDLDKVQRVLDLAAPFVMEN